jgi:hypothetical protein
MLWRTFALRGQDAPLVFVMLNPSTADGHKDDATIRRCLWFAWREGYGGIVVVNLSPWRARDPRDLDATYRRGEDVLFLEANRPALQLARSLGPFVLAWGAGVRWWMDPAARVVRQLARPGLCLGRTRKGEPRHPLMLPKDAPLTVFTDTPPPGGEGSCSR